jgi:hypothetical protein
MANRRYNIQVANDRACMAKGGSTSSGEKMRKKGAKGAPTEAAIKKSQA